MLLQCIHFIHMCASHVADQNIEHDVFLKNSNTACLLLYYYCRRFSKQRKLKTKHFSLHDPKPP